MLDVARDRLEPRRLPQRLEIWIPSQGVSIVETCGDRGGEAVERGVGVAPGALHAGEVVEHRGRWDLHLVHRVTQQFLRLVHSPGGRLHDDLLHEQLLHQLRLWRVEYTRSGLCGCGRSGFVSRVGCGHRHDGQGDDSGKKADASGHRHFLEEGDPPESTSVGYPTTDELPTAVVRLMDAAGLTEPYRRLTEKPHRVPQWWMPGCGSSA